MFIIILSPVILFLLGLGGVILYKILYYLFIFLLLTYPVLLGLLAAYLINWRSNMHKKKKIAIILLMVAIVLNILWGLYIAVEVRQALKNISTGTANTIDNSIKEKQDDQNNKEQTDKSTKNTALDVLSEVELINYEELKLVENYDYLLLSQDKTEENIKRIGLELKKMKCKKSCNISLFDDKKAYDLNEDEINYFGEALKQWDRENYVFLADHLVGFLDFETGDVEYYPLRKDLMYNEIKAGTY